MGAFEDYAAALTEFKRADEEISNMQSMFVGLGQILRDKRGQFSFSNTGVGFPPEVVMIRGNPTMDGNQWPSATKINEALARWHDARRKVQSVWGSMPAEQKQALQPPPAAAMSR